MAKQGEARRGEAWRPRRHLHEPALLERQPVEPLLQELDEAQVEGVELATVLGVRLLQPLEVVLAQPLDLDRAADLGATAEDANVRDCPRASARSVDGEPDR